MRISKLITFNYIQYDMRNVKKKDKNANEIYEMEIIVALY